MKMSNITLMGVVMTLGISTISCADIMAVNDTRNSAPSDQNLPNIKIPSNTEIMNAVFDQKNNLENETISIDEIGCKDNSIFTPGLVIQHKIKNGNFHTVPMFVVGSDSQSRRWARLNKGYLKKINAIGIITNVEDEKIKDEIEKTVGMKLIASSINGLQEIIGTTHYPFLIKDGWIFQ